MSRTLVLPNPIVVTVDDSELERQRKLLQAVQVLGYRHFDMAYWVRVPVKGDDVFGFRHDDVWEVAATVDLTRPDARLDCGTSVCLGGTGAAIAHEAIIYSHSDASDYYYEPEAVAEFFGLDIDVFYAGRWDSVAMPYNTDDDGEYRSLDDVFKRHLAAVTQGQYQAYDDGDYSGAGKREFRDMVLEAQWQAVCEYLRALIQETAEITNINTNTNPQEGTP